MAVFTIPSSPSFNTTAVDQIKESDYIIASFVNAYYEIFLNNDQYLLNDIEDLQEELEEQIDEINNSIKTQLKELSDKFSSQIGDLYFGKDDDGKWGYTETEGGEITPFRNPTGDATAADVRAGKVFSSADLEDAIGTLIENGIFIYSSSEAETINLEGIYESGSYIDTQGTYDTGYSAGYDDGQNSVSIGYKTISVSASGYNGSDSASYTCTYDSKVAIFTASGGGGTTGSAGVSVSSYSAGETVSISVSTGSNDAYAYQHKSAAIFWIKS